jgi:hypothetical protein
MKTCPVCGKKHARRPTDTATQYKRRQCCSPKCAKKLIGQVKIKYPTPTKTCACCGKPFNIRANEKPSAYQDRDTCTRSCALAVSHARRNDMTPAEWIAIAHAPRACEVCGASYHRRKSEPVRDWQKRVCCSNACSSARAETHRDRLRAAKRARAASRAPKVRKFTTRLDTRPATTPMKRWSPPQAARTPAPPPVPTAKPRRPSRAPDSLLRQIHEVFATHPELRAILDGRQA